FCQLPGNQTVCPQGFFCPPNTFQPTYCCPGYYCSSDATKMTLCPEGSYCLIGSTTPQTCTFGHCPAGSGSINKYEVIYVFIAILMLVLIYYALRKRRLRSKHLKYVVQMETMKKNQPISPQDLGKQVKKFDICFENLGLVLPNGLELMKGVSGVLRSGRSCAIMGPSGAGKSTFISLLTGKVKKTEGNIRINGKYEDLSKYRKLVGYVPQEDIMLRELTVKDILMHSAFMRLPDEWPAARKRAVVLQVIHFLGLGHIINSIVGNEEQRGISGGQRKRVNIGMELVAEPSILFLDEPTSGLDSSTSVEVCNLLSNIAKTQGLTVASVIHSPSPIAFAKFDDLLLLGKGGRVIYFGSREEAPAYFESIGFYCPKEQSHADFYLDVASGKIESKNDPDFHPNDLFEYWEQFENDSVSQDSPHSLRIHDVKHGLLTEKIPPPGYFQECVDKIKGELSTVKYDIQDWFKSIFVELNDTFRGIVRTISRKKDPIRDTASPLRVFWLCFRRALQQIIRSKGNLITEQSVHLLAGLFISIAAKRAVFLGPLPMEVCEFSPFALRENCKRPVSDPLRYIGQFITWGVGFAGIATSVNTFGNERVVFWRDIATGMPTLPYFLAKAISDVPRIVFASLMFVLALVINFPNNSSFGYLYLIVLGLYFVGFSIGYFISCLVPRDKAQLFGVIVTLFWGILCGGVQPSLATVHEYPGWLKWLWSISGPRWAISAFYLSETKHRSNVWCRYFDVESNLWDYGYQNDTFHWDIVHLFLISLMYNVLSFLALKLTHRSKQK
ncbi:hypothetical protein K493DRAFT_372289, partial [Basidiobolus meristosporus CBS 931.73]